jgi:hypothetical protein
MARSLKVLESLTSIAALFAAWLAMMLWALLS